MMQSLTFGTVNFNQIVRIIQKEVEKNPNDHYHVIIGTDSQNFDDTKIVVAIAVIREGKGGFFFYDITRMNKITNIKNKLITETTLSLQYADTLMCAFDALNWDYSNIHFSIHVDAGYNGPTKEVIPEIMAWVKSYGWDVSVKPNSCVASTIADRISK